MQTESKGTKRDLASELEVDCPSQPVPKSVHHTASKIHGIAAKRQPRIGADYQAVIPPLQNPEQQKQH